MDRSRDDPKLLVRKLSHEAAKAEQRLYWSRKTVSERLTAMTELTRRMYSMRGIDVDALQHDWTVRRVKRPRLELSRDGRSAGPQTS